MPKRARKSNDSTSKIKRAYEDLMQAHEDIKEAHMAIVLKLAIIAEYRDPDTGNHIMRISDYGCELAKAAGLSEKEIETYRFASPMHDIGKIALPDSILKKEGKLTHDEMEIMKGHTIIGARMFDNSKSPILRAAADICRGHHERWNGTGYPYGTKGDKIPFFARILAVVDVFDALVSRRCYKDAWTFEDAVKLIKSESGKHFDPRLVNLFLKVLPQIRHLYESNSIIQSFITDYEILNRDRP
ncbi:MAG: HD domain-containing protein [Candidatus Omnitrophica bacterium]|nr:HD domain-containing protein [Candidatus Omnitrophota bacterium]